MPEIRLIDATRLHAQVFNDNGGDLSKTENVAQIILRIENAPTIDAQPVKHGQWIETHISLCKWIPEDKKEEGHSFYMAEMKCSCCERYNTHTFSLTLKKPDFCQNCGAKMCGGDADADS